MFYKGYAINFYFVTSYAEHILSSLSAFFFGTRGARKKLGKKRNAEAMFRRVRAATNAARVGSAVAF